MSPSPAANPNRRKPKYPTWEHPKGSGIRIAEMPNKTGGKVYGVSYQVRIPATLLGRIGKREMPQRNTKVEAERLAEDRFLALKKHGTEFSKLPAAAQQQAAIAWSKLEPHGIDFIEAAEVAIRFLRPEGGDRTVAAVVSELLASKRSRFEAKTLDQRTYDDFSSRGKRIVEAIGDRLIKLVTHEDLARWLRKLRSEGHPHDKQPLSQRSVLNYRNILAEVFRHAHAKRYCAENPMERFTREDYKALGGEVAERKLDGISILTVGEAKRLLDTALTENVGMLASTVLRLFCGIRTAEVCRLDWEEVHWLVAKPFVHIPAGKAKKRRIRHVEIPANALAWLRLCAPPASGPVVPGNGKVKGYCKRFSRLVKQAGLGNVSETGEWESEWENNYTRHSYGSYHFALHGDALRTAKEMGHVQNDDVLFSHYRTLVSRESAEAYFNLLPDIEASKVTDFPDIASA